ncbi:MAG: hypothetical protein M3040_15250 [Bacteroidota bacterium]|nr:hypothetical protein [Bacteroidota bacterium]
MSRFIRAFFYGNIYLGICAVALCIESNLLNHISLNIFPFYLLIFFCTIIYYTMIYVRSVKAKNFNERTIWYRNNLSSIKRTLTVTIGISAFLFLLFIVKNLPAFFKLSPLKVFLIVAFPMIAAWYTFAPKFFNIKKIRQTGWIKPFIVGLTWAGWVTVYPVLLWPVQRRLDYEPHIFTLLLLWLQDFLFFSINAIIFDVKDYYTDFYHNLRTYPVIFGVKNTIRFIVLPLTLINLVTFFIFQSQQHFTFLQSFIQLIPYLLLVIVVLKYKQGRPVLYYLAAVDGLVFLKAFCGITSILLIKK